MEKERIQPARNSRTIQQRNAGSANIMDNRPDGSRNYLSATPVQRVEDDEEEDVLQGKLSAPAQRVESEEDDEATGLIRSGVIIQGKINQHAQTPQSTVLQLFRSGIVTDDDTHERFQIDCDEIQSRELERKFSTALNKGIVPPTGRSGIKRLKQGGYELKIEGFGGNSRLVGYLRADGVYVFNNFVRHAHKGRKSR